MSKPAGKLTGMVSMFEKKAEESSTPPTRSASSSITTPPTSSIAERLAAMKNLTLPTLPNAALPPLPHKALPPHAKTLPSHFNPPDASSSSSPSALPPRPAPSKLPANSLSTLNAALANGLRLGLSPSSPPTRSPSPSYPPPPLPKLDGAAAEAGSGGGGAELSHATASRAKMRRAKKATTKTGGEFRALEEARTAGGLVLAPVTLTSPALSALPLPELTTAGEAKAEEPRAPATSGKAELQRDEGETAKKEEQKEPAAVLPAPHAQQRPPTIPPSIPQTGARSARPSLTLSVPPSASELDDSLNSSLSSASSLDDSTLLVSPTSLSVYNAAACYFDDPATLGYNPTSSTSYLALLHTGATFLHWRESSHSASKRLVYLSDCTTTLAVIDGKKKVALDKVEAKRRTLVQHMTAVSKGKEGGVVWTRPACKDVLASRALTISLQAEAGGAVYLETMTGVQRDEWCEALTWLIATHSARA